MKHTVATAGATRTALLLFLILLSALPVTAFEAEPECPFEGKRSRVGQAPSR
jgi:hypothetical protein